LSEVQQAASSFSVQELTAEQAVELLGGKVETRKVGSMLIHMLEKDRSSILVQGPNGEFARLHKPG